MIFLFDSAENQTGNLSKLDLSSNLITDEGALALAEAALKSATFTKVLY